jgi:CIC family chloride channel protein
MGMGPFFLSSRIRKFLIRPKRFAILEACIIGLVSGLAAVLLKQGVGWLGGWRVDVSSGGNAWWTLPCIGLVGGFIAGLLVERLSPESAGSGIPQVKAALANIPVPLNLRVAIVKLVGVVLVMGSGLNLGRQGPTVHVGAALAAQLNRWIPTSPQYRRQLLAAGAAAGLAAGFNAPIAGVLFVVEEFLQDFSDLTLGTAILASFIGAVVARLLGDEGLSLNSTMVESRVSFSLQDVPFFLVLGLVAGVLGALFTRGLFVSLAFNRRVLRLSLPWKVGLAGLLSGIFAMLLPPAFRDNTGLPEFFSTEDIGWQIAILAFVVKFVLTLIAYGSGAPGGIFAPALILGSALGYLIGTSAATLETLVGIPLGIPAGIGSVTTYALAGMGAFFSAVTGTPITSIVIVFEMTTDFNLVLPLMFSSIVARLIGDRLGGGSLYNRLLIWNGIDLDTAKVAKGGPLTELTAATLMQRRVETLSSSMSLADVMQAFSRSHHRGFPVVEGDKLVGIISQSDLAETSRHSVDPDKTLLQDIMTPQPVTVHPADPLTHVLYLLNRFKISRLPVTDGQKLVGIITRADIIRAESDQLSGDIKELGPQPEPSYLVYQTRSPALGKGRLLVLVRNPKTAPTLLKLAAAIARQHNYELECMHVVIVPRSQSPAESPVRITISRRMLRQAEQIGRAWDIPVHTQIRAAHDSTHAILEVIKARNIDIVLMGWKGYTATPGRVLGNVVDTIVRQAACEVILVKLAHEVAFERWLVPVAGGPNSQEALKLLPALVTLGDTPDVRICQVFGLLQPASEQAPLQQAVQQLSRQLSIPVLARPIWGSEIVDAILNVVHRERIDAVVIGASREGLLQQVIKGNIPEAIARDSACTVILVRGAISEPIQPL